MNRDTITYNGATYGRVICRVSMIISAPAEKAWKVASQFGNMGSWLGSVGGQQIHTQLLGGHTVDFIGAFRVVSIANKSVFERLTVLDGQTMTMSWNVISHPLATNPFPSSFLNTRASFTISPVLIPGNQCFFDWKINLLTELHAVDIMQTIINGMMRVGLLNIQKLFTSGGRPPTQKKLQQRHSHLPPISDIPQPIEHGPVIKGLSTHTSGAMEKMQGFMSVPAPVSLQKPLLDADSIDHAAAYMEMTVPILHVAKSASSYLLEASQPRSSQCGTVAREMLQEAQAGRPQQTPSSVGSQPVDEAAPAIPTQTEGLRHKASAESIGGSGESSFGNGERSARRSISGGEKSSSSCVWQKAVSLQIARSASHPLN